MVFFTEKQAAGKFAAMARNAAAPHYPRRIGFICGGRDSWLAERGRQSLGYFKTRKAALDAIADLERAP